MSQHFLLKCCPCTLLFCTRIVGTWFHQYRYYVYLTGWDIQNLIHSVESFCMWSGLLLFCCGKCFPFSYVKSYQVFHGYVHLQVIVCRKQLPAHILRILYVLLCLHYSCTSCTGYLVLFLDSCLPVCHGLYVHTGVFLFDMQLLPQRSGSTLSSERKKMAYTKHIRCSARWRSFALKGMRWSGEKQRGQCC